jgi:hypothetical protein
MQPLFRRRAPVVAGACILIAAGLAKVVLGGDEKGRATELAYGQIYSTEDGDPIDVLADAGDEPHMVCMNVGGFAYGTSISCTDIEAAGKTGSWMLAIPESEAKPPIAVGIMPADATRAVAVVGSQRVASEARGRWFLAELEPGSLGPNNARSVDVEFAS